MGAGGEQERFKAIAGKSQQSEARKDSREARRHCNLVLGRQTKSSSANKPHWWWESSSVVTSSAESPARCPKERAVLPYIVCCRVQDDISIFYILLPSRYCSVLTINAWREKSSNLFRNRISLYWSPERTSGCTKKGIKPWRTDLKNLFLKKMLYVLFHFYLIWMFYYLFFPPQVYNGTNWFKIIFIILKYSLHLLLLQLQLKYICIKRFHTDATKSA